MQKGQEGLSSHQENKPKNIKNVYIQKINSLIQTASQDAINQSLLTYSNSKKLLKTESDGKLAGNSTEKNALKLQKNRESARKARLRKKLYVELLEGKVKTLKNQLQLGKEEEQQMQHWLQSVNNFQSQNQDLGKYICSDRTWGEEHSEAIIQEIREISMPQLMQNHKDVKHSYDDDEQIQRILSQMEIQEQQCQEMNRELMSLHKEIQILRNSQNSTQGMDIQQGMRKILTKVHGSEKEHFDKILEAQRLKNHDQSHGLNLLDTQEKILHFDKYLE